jgi:hypothetical protein
MPFRAAGTAAAWRRRSTTVILLLSTPTANSPPPIELNAVSLRWQARKHSCVSCVKASAAPGADTSTGPLLGGSGGEASAIGFKRQGPRGRLGRQLLSAMHVQHRGLLGCKRLAPASTRLLARL